MSQVKWYTFLIKLEPHLRTTTSFIEVRLRSARLNSLTSVVPSSKEEDSSRGQLRTRLVKEYLNYCQTTLDMRCEYLADHLIHKNTVVLIHSPWRENNYG